MRIVITGGPRTGKTTLAGGMEGTVRHTDDLIKTHAWSEASEAVAGWFNEPGPWVVEGVSAVRALRKWLDRGPLGKPCDRVIWMDRAQVPLTPGQEHMTKGCWKIWGEIMGELTRRGVIIEVR